jgi:hypothetical protein
MHWDRMITGTLRPLTSGTLCFADGLWGGLVVVVSNIAVEWRLRIGTNETLFTMLVVLLYRDIRTG